MNRKPLLLLPILTLTAAAAHAQTQSSGLNSGLTVGYYFPTFPLVKNAFGNSVLSYGIGSVGTNRPSSGSVTPDTEITSASANGNRLFVATYTYGYEYHLGNNKKMVPYARGFTGLSYFDMAIDTDNGGREGIKRIGYTYGAEVGLVYLSRFRLAARYNVYSKEDAFSFNGFTANLTWALW